MDDPALISTVDGVFPRVPQYVEGRAWADLERARAAEAERAWVDDEPTWVDDEVRRYVWLDAGSDEPHPLVAERERLGFPPSGSESVAVVDWSAVHNACTLFETPDRVLDPFTAALDLTTVVAALIFYDYVVCLDYGDVAARLSSQLHLEQDLLGIVPAGSAWGQTPSLAALIETYFSEAQAEFERAAREGEKWLASLAERWERLLPAVAFPAHDYDAFTNLHGAPYDGYANPAGSVNLARDNLFELNGAVYEFRGDLRLADLILDNDRRSLFYEFLIEELRDHWNPERTHSFRYLATCLRTPMKLARADWAAEQLRSLTPAPEDWLQAEWQKLYAPITGRLPMPFWLGAVLAGSRSKDDFPSALARLRESAKRFRRRRLEIEDALFAGDLERVQRLEAALAGDAQKLTETANTRASSGLEVIDTTFKALAPVPLGPKSATALVAAVNPGWFRAQWLKLFQPQVWFVYELGREARRVTNVLPVLFERFEVARGVAAEPIRFLQGMGTSSAPV